MFSISKLKIYGVILGIIGIITLGALWRVEVSTNKSLQKENCTLTDSITRLTSENAKLTEYNKKKDAEISRINKEYVERLKNIPADSCGDSFPSEELLEYLRGK